MKIIVTALLAIVCLSGNAQDTHKVLAFKKGDKYNKRMFASSSCLLTRGDQTLNINSYADVLKSYNISDVSGSDYVVDVTVQKIVDTINALGQKVSYNSDLPVDTSSSIAKALQNITGKAQRVVINNNELISSISNSSAQYYNDTLLSFAGLQPEQYAKGGSLGLTADFKYDARLKKAYSWGDSTKNNDKKMVNVYKIDDINAATTTISFTTSIFDSYLNSNINGVMVIDNISGLILNRQTQSITTGYELVNGVVYAATRRSIVTESSYKK